jgi:hypothetical protein
LLPAYEPALIFKYCNADGGVTDLLVDYRLRLQEELSSFRGLSSLRLPVERVEKDSPLWGLLERAAPCRWTITVKSPPH